MISCINAYYFDLHTVNFLYNKINFNIPLTLTMSKIHHNYTVLTFPQKYPGTVG